MDTFDLAVIGGGPAGYTAAGRASSAGMRTVLFEADKIGGVCLNEGCIPTKVMLNSSKLLYHAKNGPAYGVVTPVGTGAAGDNAFRLSQETVLARKEKVIKTLTAGVRSKLRAANADVRAGRAEIVGRKDNGYAVLQTDGEGAGREIIAGRVLFAIGSSPVLPPAAGVRESVESGFAITSREALSLAEIPKKLVIIGGGVIGLELADYYNAAGADVTVVELLDRVAFPMESEISKIVLQNLLKRGVKFRLASRFTEIILPGADSVAGGVLIVPAGAAQNAAGAAQDTAGTAQNTAGAAQNAAAADKPVQSAPQPPSNDGASQPSGGASQPSGGGLPRTFGETIPADKVLIAVGRKPNLSGAGLEKLGVYIDRGAVVTDEYMRTNIPNIYAAGDVNGKYMLAHTAYREAECAVSHMLGKPAKMRYGAIPSVIYTYPEAAGVGETEESAAEKGIAVKTVKLPLRYSGRYIAETEGGDGICKMIFDARKGTVAGVHIAGTYASELVLAAVFMAESRMPASSLKEIVFPHPTVGEVFREALFEFE